MWKINRGIARYCEQFREKLEHTWIVYTMIIVIPKLHIEIYIYIKKYKSRYL